MTDKLREAAQALVDRWDTPNWKDAPHTGKYINELRAALAEQEAEPVAITTATQIEEMQHGYSRVIVGKDPKFWFVKRDSDVPLYTVPPRREWQGLTDEERKQFSAWMHPDVLEQIEQTLKGKNHD